MLKHIFWVTVAISTINPTYSKLLDKTIAVFNDEVITLSQVKRISRNIESRKFISPQVYNKKKYTKSLIIDEFFKSRLIRSKLSEIGYIVGKRQIDAQIKSVEQRLGLTRKDLLEFLKKNNLSFKEYYEITRSTIEYNIFVSKIITPLVKVTEQQVKNRYYKINNNKKTLAFKYTLVDFSLPKKSISRDQRKSAVSHLKKFQKTGILPSHLEHIQTNVIENVTEDGLTATIKNALRDITENQFTQPLIISNDVHLFFVKSKKLVDSTDYLKKKKLIEMEIFNESSSKVSAEWIEREMRNHHTKKFLN